MYVNVLIIVAFSIVLAFCFARISTWKWINKVFGIISYKSINNSVWKDFINFDEGTRVLITVKDNKTMYYGNFLYCEENGENSWFVLSDYAMTIDGRNTYSMCKEHPTAKLLIQMKDVSRVELIYDNNQFKE